MSYSTSKNYEGGGAGGGTSVGALKVDKLANGNWAVFANLAALQAAYAAYRKPPRGFSAVVGTVSGNPAVVQTITVAYVWDTKANAWQPVVTNFKGADGGKGTKGDTGPAGGFDFDGDYDNSKVYALGKTVRWINPANNAVGIWENINGGQRGNLPSDTTYWKLIIEAEQAHPKPHPQFKAEAIWEPTPANDQHMATGTPLTQLIVKWNILERSAADEVITRVDLTFDNGISGQNNIQNANHQYTYNPDIAQPAFVSEATATLVITTNKGNVARLSHSFSWKTNWYSGYLAKAAADLTVADVTGGFATANGNEYPRSIRIRRSANTNARVFVLLEELNHKTLPANFHLDLFPYLHKVDGKTLVINGRTYQVYASTQQTHANDLTVTAAYQ